MACINIFKSFLTLKQMIFNWNLNYFYGISKVNIKTQINNCKPRENQICYIVHSKLKKGQKFNCKQ